VDFELEKKESRRVNNRDMKQKILEINDDVTLFQTFRYFVSSIPNV
jgi:hypothetical protein